MKFLKNHTSEETAYTSIMTCAKYWIETSELGQRICKQAYRASFHEYLAIKKSSYSAIMLMRVDEDEDVEAVELSLYSPSGVILAFSDKYSDELDDTQLETLKSMIFKSLDL